MQVRTSPSSMCFRRVASPHPIHFASRSSRTSAVLTYAAKVLCRSRIIRRRSLYTTRELSLSKSRPTAVLTLSTIARADGRLNFRILSHASFHFSGSFSQSGILYRSACIDGILKVGQKSKSKRPVELEKVKRKGPGHMSQSCHNLGSNFELRRPQNNTPIILGDSAVKTFLHGSTSL